MEGYLQKWTNYLFGWRERWVVIKGSILYYYINKNEMPRGRLHLAITNLTFNDSDARFEIDTGTTIIYLRAETIEEKNKWISALKIAKLSAENSIKNVPKNILLAESNDLSQSMNENNVITEDILIQKIKLALQTSERLKEQQHRFELFCSNHQYLVQAENDLSSIYDQFKIEIYSINSQLNNLKEKFVQFNKDFIKISEFFFNHVNKSTDYRGGGFFEQSNVELVSDKNLLSKVKSNKKAYNRLVSTEQVEMIQNGDDVYYYSADEDEEELLKSNNDDKNKQGNDSIQAKTVQKKFYDALYDKKRHALPFKRTKYEFNIWKILKDAIGKDLNRFCVPVFFNEPISMLQKLCENFQYAYVLNNAAQEPNSYIRLALSATFCIGGFTMNVRRAAKYFNPLLGETFEYVDNTLGYRFFSEQVSHHPAISACFAEGKDWTFYANSNALTKFIITGALDIVNLGKSYINFPNFNETVAYTKPMIIAKNLIFGPITLDIYGKFTVTNDSGDIAEIELIPMSSEKQGLLKGIVKDIYNTTKLLIEGNWLDKIEVIDPKTQSRKTIWTFINGIDEEEYYFPPITIELNNLTDELRDALPHSDSRFRPDQRCMEIQDLDKAKSEKQRLEDNQRKRQKEREKNGIVYHPMYFDETYDDITGELIYKYNGNYWDDRNKKNFSKFIDIFNSTIIA